MVILKIFPLISTFDSLIVITPVLQSRHMDIFFLVKIQMNISGIRLQHYSLMVIPKVKEEFIIKIYTLSQTIFIRFNLI